MKHLMMVVACLLLSVGTVLADDLKDASDKVSVLSERLAKLTAGKTAEYAKPQLDAVQATLGALKAAIAAKNGVQAIQKAEYADLQLTFAEAKAAEQESAEQLVLRRAELRKYEGQFDQLLQGGK